MEKMNTEKTPSERRKETYKKYNAKRPKRNYTIEQNEIRKLKQKIQRRQKHLKEGVTKGALTQEQADTKWDAWMQEKEAKVAAKKGKLEQETRTEMKKRLEAEAGVNKERAAALLAKREEAAARLAAAAAAAAAKAEVTIAEIEGTAVPEAEEDKDQAATE